MVKHPNIDLLVDIEGNIYSLDGIKRKPQDYGYMKIMVNRKCYAVHRLIAETFLSNEDNKPMVNHINGDRKDNRIENLEWVTATENMQKASLSGSLVTSNRKKIDVYTIYGDLVCTKDSIAQVAEMFNTLPCAISTNVKRGSMTKGYYVVEHGKLPDNIYAKITGC